jgi:hypothetical protein
VLVELPPAGVEVLSVPADASAGVLDDDPLDGVEDDEDESPVGMPVLSAGAGSTPSAASAAAESAPSAIAAAVASGRAGRM